MGSRMFGFTQELFDDTPDVDPEVETEMYEAMAEALSEHRRDDRDRDARRRVTRRRPGCDDQFEFEFALDLMLDGLEKVRDRS